MPTKNDVMRITVDLPLTLHKKLKAVAALTEKKMRTIVIESVEKELETICTRDHTPNEETRQVIEEARKGEGLHSADTVDAFFKMLNAS